MKKKLKSTSGETLVETLFAMLVIVLAVMVIAGGVVTAARINKKAKDLDTTFQMSNVVTVTDEAKPEVTITHGSVKPDKVSIDAWQTNDNNKYYYYSKKKSVNQFPEQDDQR